MKHTGTILFWGSVWFGEDEKSKYFGELKEQFWRMNDVSLKTEL